MTYTAYDEKCHEYCGHGQILEKERRHDHFIKLSAMKLYIGSDLQSIMPYIHLLLGPLGPFGPFGPVSCLLSETALFLALWRGWVRFLVFLFLGLNLIHEHLIQ